MYKVLADFKDLRDGGHEYHTGDPYPREGYPVSAERIAMLSAPTPQRGALIGEVETIVMVSQEQEATKAEAKAVNVEPAEDEKPKKKKKTKE